MHIFERSLFFFLLRSTPRGDPSAELRLILESVALSCSRQLSWGSKRRARYRFEDFVELEAISCRRIFWTKPWWWSRQVEVGTFRRKQGRKEEGGNGVFRKLGDERTRPRTGNKSQESSIRVFESRSLLRLYCIPCEGDAFLSRLH